MPGRRIADIFSSTASGAASGAAITPGSPIGPIVGGGVGLFAGLFGGGEDTIEDRFNKYLQKIRSLKQEAAARGQEMLANVAQAGRGLVSSTRQAAAERAAAAGRTGEIESFIAPAEAQATRAASEAMRRSVSDFNRLMADYDRLEAGAQLQGLYLPQEPGFLDYFMEGAGILGRYALLSQALSRPIPGNVPTLQNQPTPQSITNPAPVSEEQIFGPTTGQQTTNSQNLGFGTYGVRPYALPEMPPEDFRLGLGQRFRKRPQRGRSSLSMIGGALPEMFYSR